MRHILIIDDEPLILEIAQLSLETVGGWRVSTAGTAPDGIRRAAASRPDAILLDVMMPGMDGPTACRRLAADPCTAEIPVILLTAKVQSAEKRRWADLPVAGVLAKPFDPMLLPGDIEKLLGWSEPPPA